MRALIIVPILLLGYTTFSQTGPGGVGNAGSNVLWLSADYGVYSDAGVTPATNNGNVAQWNDRSGNAVPASHAVSGERPNYQTNVLNGFPVIRFTAANGDRLLSSGVATGNTASVFAVAAWSSVPSSNPGIIHAGPSAFSTNADDKVIGMWVSNGAGNQVWGRGVQSNGTVVNIPQVTNTSTGTFHTFLNEYNGANINQYVNNSIAGSVAYNGTLDTWSEFGIGRQGSETWNGDIAEVIAYNVSVNAAQRIIINNYLAAKYGLSLTSDDVYTQDGSGFDYEVAGIGRVNASNIHNDAQGSGIVRILNPTDLEDNEFLMWGHNNGTLQATNTTDIPTSVSARFDRVWRVSETGGDANVGSVDIQFDLSGLPDFASLSTCDAALSIRLLVDTDNDGVFSDQTPIGGATNIGGNIYRFAGVNALTNNVRFTLAIYNPSVDGPGGVGGTTGATSLVLWLDANRVSAADGATVTTWEDQSGFGNHFTSGNGAVFNATGTNGYPTLSFDGSTHYFERPFSASLTPNTFSIFAATNVTSSTAYKAVISNRDDPPGDETRGFILYSVPTSNNWQFWNGNLTIAWEQTNSTVSTAGSWAGQTATYQNGAGTKILYINNTSAATSTHTLNPNTTRPIRVGAGQNEAGPNFFFQGQMGEVFVYNTVLNAAQRRIVNNYLSAKYGYTLTTDDTYTRDDAGQGNFDHDVAGIGRVDAANAHSDAKGTGIVRVNNPSSLGNNDFLFWGHDNVPLSTINTTNLPAGIQGRLERRWRVSELNNVGTITMTFDLSGMGPITVSDLRLLVDDDGNFANGGTTQYTATALACNNYQFAGVTAITNGSYFTIGTTNISQTPLPIELVSFTGLINDGNVHLSWTTASEINNESFTIERSIDGKNFLAVSEVAGSGTTHEKVDYYFIDRFVPYGRLYYRLKQTDFDLAYSYSDVITIDHQPQGTKLIAVPNPVQGNEPVRLRIMHAEQIDMTKAALSVHDLYGRTIPFTTEIGAHGEIIVSLANVQASGIYVIGVRSSQLRTPLYTRVQLLR